MSTIQKVTVIGGSGNLGPSIVQALLGAGFTVTVLTRLDSNASFPQSVNFHKIDYDSTSSLEEALKGQDAVVSVIGGPGIPAQKKIIDAALKVGIKRYIPSEFGVNTRKVDGGIAKILSGKIAVVDYLKTVAAEHPDFTWTGLSTSLFFDWGLKVGSLGISIPNQSITIFDSGDEVFEGTNLRTIGLAVSSILKHPAETANAYLSIASFRTTQNSLLALLEDETGTKWTVKREKTDDHLKTADEKLSKGDFSAFGNYLKFYLFKDGHGHAQPEEGLANESLGLPKEDLRQTLKAAL